MTERYESERADPTKLSDVELLNYCGDSGLKWAEAFCQIKQKQGWSAADIDESLMLGWFANAIEHSTALRHNAPPDYGAGKSASNAWRSISKDTSWVDGRDVVLLANDMEVQARYCPGEWSDETPSSPREYSGAVWSCFDDQFQLEIEECSKDPSEWGHDGATHWRPTSELPPTVLPDHGGADAVVKAQIAALAHRFWTIHPRELQDKGMTREDFYIREMTALVAAISKPAPVAANASAELQNDLAEMLRALGMSDAAQPKSPHEVFQSAIAEMKRQIANSSAEEQLNMTEDQIKHMVDRFLGWKLPRDTFNPDCGISFDKEPFNTHTPYPSQHEPSGTNLFNATQATAMVRYMLEGLPRPNASAEARLREALEDIATDVREHGDDSDGIIYRMQDRAKAALFNEEERVSGELTKEAANLVKCALSAHPHASDCDKQKECCDLAAKEPCADCPFPNPDVAMRGLTDLERTLLIAAKAAQNYIANTESEMGMTLKSGDLLRAAIAKAECYVHASDCDKQGERK